MAKLPKTIFVKRKTDSDVSYLLADDNMAALVDMGETFKLGMYELVETREVTGVVSSKRVR